MGKRLRQQRRGKGSLVYQAPSHRFLTEARYKVVAQEGTVVDIVHDPSRYSPVMVVDFGVEKQYLLAPSGIKTGDKISYGGDVKLGNILELGEIPEGTKVCNIELNPGDGGKLCRAPGTFATVLGHEGDKTLLALRSKFIKTLSNKCKAMIGVISGSGHRERPFMKAGNRYYAMKAKGRYYPIVSASSKSAVYHPLGGQTSPGRPRTVSRHMPPGKKVGSISPRRTGKKK
ncbi:MAG: 50S ribosomal protein L2 [Candidatus Aenigmatarchaeota archaeon]|nr:50S ribosomal protein L2 [Candidatus Aenigmarchaeota archaeon]